MQGFGGNVSIVLLDLNGRVGDEIVEDMVSRHGMTGRYGRMVDKATMWLCQ